MKWQYGTDSNYAMEDSALLQLSGQQQLHVRHKHQSDKVHIQLELAIQQKHGYPNNERTWGNTLADELQQIVNNVPLGWNSIVHDFTIVPQSHPCVRLALALPFEENMHNAGRLHVYTDGSAWQGTRATWAFVVLKETLHENTRVFTRIGFAGAHVCDDLSDPFLDALEAETTAIIFAADYLIGHRDKVRETFLHFDAVAAGMGAVGQTRLVQRNDVIRPRQKQARVLLHLLTEWKIRVMPYHVHAHEGNPFNEMADSIAHALLKEQLHIPAPQCQVLPIFFSIL